MQILMDIIGYFEEKCKCEIPDIEDCRPEKCPRCGILSRGNGILQVIGHGTYDRWACIPNSVKIKIRRFLCKKCRKTCSVLPHGLLPRFQYSAHIILLCLLQFYVDGKTEASVISNVLQDKGKKSFGFIRRWGTKFLTNAYLWGWLGNQLGVRKNTKPSRHQIRLYIDRFLLNYKDYVGSNQTLETAQIVQISLSEMVFDKKKAFRSFHIQHETKTSSVPLTKQFAANTQYKEHQKNPP